MTHFCKALELPERGSSYDIALAASIYISTHILAIVFTCFGNPRAFWVPASPALFHQHCSYILIDWNSLQSTWVGFLLILEIIKLYSFIIWSEEVVLECYSYWLFKKDKIIPQFRLQLWHWWYIYIYTYIYLKILHVHTALALLFPVMAFWHYSCWSRSELNQNREDKATMLGHSKLPSSHFLQGSLFEMTNRRELCLKQTGFKSPHDSLVYNF